MGRSPGDQLRAPVKGKASKSVACLPKVTGYIPALLEKLEVV